MPRLKRRTALVGGAALLASAQAAARSLAGALPRAPAPAAPPSPAGAAPWRFFTPEEGAAVAALADRLIPPDPPPPAGTAAAVALFIDRRLAGPYGTSALDTRPPVRDGPPTERHRPPQVPAARYRLALRGIDAHCRATFAGRGLARLAEAERDRVIAGLARNDLALPQTDARVFLALLLRNTAESFVADPVNPGDPDWRA